MPVPGTPLDQLGFLTIGTFDPADPGPGHEATLAMVELGEQLGFDSAWLRHRHLQHGISSPVAVLAAATQRTRRIGLGTAVTPLAWENPLRLAEDLATVDVLSGGRLNPGISVGPPMRWDDVREALYPDTAEVEDFSYRRVRRLLPMSTLVLLVTAVAAYRILPPIDAGGVASDLRAAARLYATGGNGAIYYGLGVTEHSQGSTTVIGIANLAIYQATCDYMVRPSPSPHTKKKPHH